MAKQAQEKPVIDVKLVQGKENIVKLITEVSVSGKKLEVMLHTAACSIIAHIEKHREVSLANQLIEALPSSTRKNALKDWFISFGKMTYDEESKLMVFKKTAKTKQVEAEQMPFWTFQPEAEYKPFNLDVAITNLVKIATARQEKGNSKDVIPTAKLEQLKKLA